ncbi:MAG: XdhC family protein, partial [Jannaschia sp.]
GAVTLVIERLETVPPVPWLRRVEGDRPAPDVAAFGLRNGWMWEGGTEAGRPLWIWGAGHVGAAVAQVAAPLPDFAVTCIEDDASRWPALPPAVRPLLAADMARAMTHAPRDALHLIVTYSHDIDLALCHAALARGFGFCGLIGSDTKWARFRARLRDLGHSEADIAKITCPIGDRRLGKHPQAIAVGVVAGLLFAELSGETAGDQWFDDTSDA